MIDIFEIDLNNALSILQGMSFEKIYVKDLFFTYQFVCIKNNEKHCFDLKDLI